MNIIFLQQGQARRPAQVTNDDDVNVSGSAVPVHGARFETETVRHLNLKFHVKQLLITYLSNSEYLLTITVFVSEII